MVSKMRGAGASRGSPGAFDLTFPCFRPHGGDRKPIGLRFMGVLHAEPLHERATARPAAPSMTAPIFFHEFTDVPPHTAEIDLISRKGDLLHIPSIGGRGHSPVAREKAGNLVLSGPDDSPQVRLRLGVAQQE